MNILEQNKGEDIVLMDIHEQAIFADYFVICSGTSRRMLAGLVKDVIDGIRDVSGLKPRLEGEASEGWLLLDYGDIILHMFSTEQREYYDLESLWSDSKVLIHLQ